MTRLNPALSGLKTINITYPTPLETLLASPETLPTSEPTTPQISYTVQSANLPILDFNVYSKKYVAVVIGAGKFVTAGTCYWRMKKNGASVNTGSFSVSANNYYTVHARFLDVAVGDVLELALWSNQTDSNWDYKAFFVLLTRVVPTANYAVLKPCNYTFTQLPTLTLGNPSIVYTYGPVFTFSGNLTETGRYGSFSSLSLPYQAYAENYGLFRVQNGDFANTNAVSTRTSASYRPHYERENQPTKIVFRRMVVD